MNERIFDLDDVRALGDAFTPEELRWVTLPKAWKDAAPLDDPAHADFAGMNFREATRHSWRTGTEPTVDQIQEQEMYFSRTWHSALTSLGMEAVGSVASRNALLTLDRKFEALVGEQVSRKRIGAPFTALEACWLNDMDDHILLARHTLEQPGNDVGIIWACREGVTEILLRKEQHEESIALREVAEQAMAQQDDQPVRRPRVRL